MNRTAMMNRLLVLVLVLSILCTADAEGHRGEIVSPDREVEVQVQVRNPSREPIGNAPIQVASRAQSAFGVTTDSGAATIRLAVGQSESLVWIRLGPRPQSVLDPDDWLAEFNRYKQLIAAHRYRFQYPLAITPSQDAYQIQILAEPSVRVSGTMLDGNGSPTFGTCAVLGSAGGAFTAQDGSFSSAGVPKDAECFVVLSASSTPRLHIVPLTAAQTAADVDLGAVVMPDYNGAAPVRISMTGGADTDLPFELNRPSVTLISADGLTVLVLNKREGVFRDVSKNPEALPLLISGRYFVAPGGIGPGTYGERVLHAVRSGKNLDGLGVPEITAVDGQETVLNINAGAAVAAIMALPD